MLIGCCHCESESEPSVPSESSESQSAGPATATRTGCFPDDERCLNNTAPVIFSFNVATVAGTKYECHANYVGDFSVFLKASPPTVCWIYESAEFVKVLGSLNLPCSDHASIRRYGISIQSIGGVNTRLTLSCGIVNGGFFVTLCAWTFNGPSLGINCVSSFTLTKVTTDTFGYPFPTTVVISPA